MLLNNREFKFLKNYRNIYGKLSAKREYRDENVFLKVERAVSELSTLLIFNKKEFNYFFKSRRAYSCELRAKRADFFSNYYTNSGNFFYKEKLYWKNLELIYIYSYRYVSISVNFVKMQTLLVFN